MTDIDKINVSIANIVEDEEKREVRYGAEKEVNQWKENMKA